MIIILEDQDVVATTKEDGSSDQMPRFYSSSKLMAMADVVLAKVPGSKNGYKVLKNRNGQANNIVMAGCSIKQIIKQIER